MAQRIVVVGRGAAGIGGAGAAKATDRGAGLTVITGYDDAHTSGHPRREPEKLARRASAVCYVSNTIRALHDTEVVIT